jgi:hypothetical protein
MATRLVQRVIAGLFFSGFIFALSGCIPVQVTQTEVRDLPDEVRVKLSRGDTRQKVRSVLGDPLIDVRNIGVEVYLQSGRDIYMDIVFVLLRLPVPFPGDKFSVITLVVYDENEVVRDIAADLWSHGSVGETWGDNYGITAGEFSFVNIVKSKPDTILGPPISWQDLAGMAAPEGSCSLVLVMGDCPMEQVSLDANLIADLSPAGDHCVLNMGSPPRKRHFFGTFIQKAIPVGSHRLSIHQGAGDSDFETDFECAPGEVIYAEIEVQPWGPAWYGGHVAGSISIRKSIPNNVVEMGKLRQILWRKDTWYGASNSSGAYSQ